MGRRHARSQSNATVARFRSPLAMSAAAAAIEQSLDEYAKSKPGLMKEFRRGSKTTAPSKPNRGRQQKNSSAGQASRSFGSRSSAASYSSTRSPIVQKPKHQQSAWKRDKFSQPDLNTPRRQQQQPRSDVFTKNQTPTEVVISGLPRSVTNATLRKVLSGCSGYLKSTLHLNSSGNTTGFADVKFVSHAEAVRAVRYLNGQNFNGSQITAQCMSQQQTPRSSFTTHNSATTPHRKQQQQMRPSPRFSGPKSTLRRNSMTNAEGVQKQSRKRRSTMPSQDQLDRELEAYKLSR